MSAEAGESAEDLEARILEGWTSHSYRLGWLESAVESAIRPGSREGIRGLRKAYAEYERRCRLIGMPLL